ncbi:xylulokinase [Novosphingobium guangzhouense]|uniref:Xylulose kinase n=1 Tax=Novosphingobium guangzhouense TaxID=1850347 RepID=A0A2K2G1F8_9SPHN|nr:xylulokinase [Novosphingobium guangzhouense]PNU04832.1 xylulokinase [Novosphingobium guangzhouense]
MYLGIDIGTSGVKAVLADDGGAVVEQAVIPLSVSRLHPLWSEQSPSDWWSATERAVAALDPALRRKVRAIGLSGQMHGAVVLDASDKVLRPAILWNDGRAGPQCAQLLELEPRTHTITGNPVVAGFTAPKLLWLARHEPEVFAAIRTVLLPKDWLRLMMTGEKLSDMSDASGTLWLDVGARDWSDAMLDACGLSRAAMPGLVEGSAPAGRLTAKIAERWGMERVPVAGGAGDNAAGAIGLGVTHPGEAFLSLGTSGVIFSVSNGFQPDVSRGIHAFAHALPDTWHRMTVMLSAAACLDWAARVLAFPDVAALLAQAEEASVQPGVIFLPYLSGERSPHPDPDAQGVWFGMTSATTRADLAKAVLEGVAMGLRDGLDALEAGGDAIGELAMAGGGSRSMVWGQIIAAALGRPLVWRANAAVGPALGAAHLARMAIDGVDTCPAAGPEISRIEPEARLAARMAEHQPRFRALYTALKDHWIHDMPSDLRD